MGRPSTGMTPCLLGRLTAALALAFWAARFARLVHLLEERCKRRVGLAGHVFGDLHRFALGGCGGLAGFADGWFGVGLGHRFADALLFIGGQARGLGATGGGLLTIAFALARGFAARLGFGLTVAFFAASTRLGVRLAIAPFTLTRSFTGRLGFGLASGLGVRLAVAAFGAARFLAAGLGLGLAAGLVGLTLFHGLTDLFKNRGNGGVGFAGGFIGGLAGFLLGLGGGLLGLGGLLMRFLYGRVLIGFLHGLAEALLFVRGERYRETWVGAAFGGRSLGSEVWARGVFGCETEGGEEEQG